MIPTKRATIIACLLPMLAACGSSAPVRYFALEADTATGYELVATEEKPILGVGPLTMPEYLGRSQMVTRGPGAEMIVDDFNRWAEPLDRAIHRIVASNIDSLVDGVAVVAFPYSSMIAVDYRLIGRVDRFDADETGRTILDVQWGIGRPDRTLMVAGRRRHYEVQARSASDPDAIAQAMNDLVNEFSRDVADELKAALQN
ncbi:MAG: PqiC family protein [Gammaproteobacteria bacterium]|nr:PqiC family protein [Gammaproteobacteria bacterium]